MIRIQTQTNIDNNIKKYMAKWSYSKVDCFKGCGFKFKLKYIDGNFAYSGSIATEFGTAIHHAEESIALCLMDHKEIDYLHIRNQFIIDCTKIKYRYRKDWDNADKHSNKTYETKYQEYLNSGIYRLENYLKANPELSVVGAEVKIDFKFDDKYKFSGSIDRLLYNNKTNSYVIHDIKSWPEITQDILDDAKTPLQFVVYSLALAKMKGVDPSTIFCQYDLPIPGKMIDIVSKGYLARGSTKLRKLFTSIENDEFIPNPRKFCHWCEFNRTNENASEKTKWLCPFGSTWTRERPLDVCEFAFSKLEDYPLVLEAYHKKHNVGVATENKS